MQSVYAFYLFCLMMLRAVTLNISLQLTSSLLSSLTPTIAVLVTNSRNLVSFRHFPEPPVYLRRSLCAILVATALGCVS